MKTALSLIGTLSVFLAPLGAQIAEPIIGGNNAAPGEFPSTVAHGFTEEETIRPARRPNSRA